ncbi:hypothetical protein NOS3756_10220 [Nostoc sp. NIES-3756]|uniref:hypothetical protein n=1 Tax=Nostoc sp. NIES-3756 TaxID=1751286 RepID=UPI000720E7F2|nr:hypothetical protein [Nostoc sp. NIES-3756]BAT52091.1 hypothetical protein NOS3756_10220 [Nostoc sp. NIES-3756]
MTDIAQSKKIQPKVSYKSCYKQVKAKCLFGAKLTPMLPLYKPVLYSSEKRYHFSKQVAPDATCLTLKKIEIN